MKNVLNTKQKLFADEYLIDLNATAAYKRAGYSGKGHVAESAAQRLLSNVDVAHYVKLSMDKRSKSLGIDAEYVLKTIKTTIERCSQVEQVKEKDGTVSGEYRFDSGAVLKGAELLGRHFKMFTDKHEVGGDSANPLCVQIIRFSDVSKPN